MSYGPTTPEEERREMEKSGERARKYLIDEAVKTMDASAWALAFVVHFEHNPSIASDEDTMRGWFANAIMCGYDRKRPTEVKP